jgi:hypothetical protein
MGVSAESTFDFSDLICHHRVDISALVYSYVFHDLIRFQGRGDSLYARTL